MTEKHPTNAHADTLAGNSLPEESRDSLEKNAEAYCPSCEQSFPTSQQSCPNDGARLVLFTADADALEGRSLDDRFEIRERIGSGGMGAVYRALQTSVGRDVAIKVIHTSLSSERATVKRFLREAKLSSRLSHANTVVVHDFGQSSDGLLYLVMELLEGQTLRSIMEAGEPLALSRVKRIGLQLSDALQAASEFGIVHRDLKPANIMLLAKPTGRDRVKVLDFGLAKSLAADSDSTEITRSGALMGTPLYMAPEVINGEPATPATDLYALGCILYEMVAGHPPFSGPTVSALFAQHLTEDPPALDLDDELELMELISGLMSKDPADRPRLGADVHARLGGETVLSASSSAPRRRRGKPSDSKENAGSIVSTAETILGDSAASPASDVASVRAAAPAAPATPATPMRHGRGRLALALGAAIAVATGIVFLLRSSYRSQPRAPAPATTSEQAASTESVKPTRPGQETDAVTQDPEEMATPGAMRSDDGGLAPTVTNNSTPSARGDEKQKSTHRSSRRSRPKTRTETRRRHRSRPPRETTPTTDSSASTSPPATATPPASTDEPPPLDFVK